MYTEFELNFRTAFQLLCPARTFPVSAGRGLPYTLATCGFDVWLSNQRDGFGYSSHIYLDPQRDPQYWNVNLDSYTTDAKSVVDYVRRQTKAATVGAFCHSISCTTLIQLLADYSPYNDLLKPVFLLAPMIYSGNVTSIPLTLPALAVPLLRWVLLWIAQFC